MSTTQIIDERYVLDVPYGDIAIGTIFEMSGGFYIKTEIHESDTKKDVLAVDLTTGFQMPIGARVSVSPVDATITVRSVRG